MMKGTTIREACYEWVGSFNAIPYGICEKLLRNNCDELYEVTPPAIGDQVCIWDGERNGDYGEIVETRFDGEDDLYRIQIDGADDDIVLAADEFEVQRDGVLPMWGTLWAFDDSADGYWLQELDGLQKMADCGFRIYEQEDYGYIFGIDGAGYDFYEAHWIPLYKARGLQWHDPETEVS